MALVRQTSFDGGDLVLGRCPGKFGTQGSRVRPAGLHTCTDEVVTVADVECGPDGAAGGVGEPIASSLKKGVRQAMTVVDGRASPPVSQ